LTFAFKKLLLHKVFDKSIQKQIKMRQNMADVYAIFKTGGKQYRVKVGDIIKVEKLKAEGNIDFDTVIMLGDQVGSPTVAGAKVKAQVVAQERTDKILVFKKKRRHNYRRTKGHRQHITVLKITEIKG